MDIQTQLLNNLAEMEKDESLLNDNVIPSPDGQLHTPDDDCGAEDPSHLAYAKAICDRQINYLNSLPSDQQARVLGVVGFTPAQRIKAILLNTDIHQPGLFLSKDDIAIAVKDCYAGISAGRYDGNEVFAVIEGVLDRTKEDALIKGEGIEGGVEQLLFLASRFVKGQACEGEGCDAGIISKHNSIQGDFEDAMKEFEDFANEYKMNCNLSTKGRFALNKLCKIFGGGGIGDGYTSFQHFTGTPDPSQGTQDWEQLEEMWCHQNEDCDCWDSGIGEYHSRMCRLNGW